MSKILTIAWLLLSAMPLSAQSGVKPKEKIPAEMLLQLKELDLRFANLVSRECGNNKCVPRGCVYLRHEVVTLASKNSLPGLSVEQGNAVVDHKPQYFLSRARCEYAFEPAIEKDEIKKFDKRFSAKLSKGILQVSVRSIALPEKPELAAAVLDTPEKPSVFKEFLVKYLAHLIFIALGLMVFLIVVWAIRRLGKDSMEDKLRMLQMKKEIEAAEIEKRETIDQAAELKKRVDHLTNYFSDNNVKLQNIVKKWLEKEDFEKIAYSSHIFAQSGLTLLPSETKYLQMKIRLQKYVDEDFLYEDRHLERTVVELEEAIAFVDGLYDERAEKFRFFFKNCHPRGFAEILGMVHADIATTLYVLAPYHLQKSSLSYCSEDWIQQATHRLLKNPFVSDEELNLVEQVMDLTREGKKPAHVTPQKELDYGTPLNVAGPLSLLLARVTSEERSELWEKAKGENGGRVPKWTEGVFYNDILNNLSDTQLKALFLECDAKRLAAWYASSLPNTLKERLALALPESYVKVLRSPVFQESSQEDQQLSLGQALVKLCRQGSIRFEEVY